MTTPTREQVAQWSNDCGTHDRRYPGFTDGLIKLATLARADLEEKVDQLTRQRDLAVEALMKCKYRSLVDKVVDDALEAIKESDGK